MNRYDFRARFTIGALVGVIATIAYRSIQYTCIARAEVRSDCWTWHILPFAPEWIWPYLSMFLIVGMPWFVLADLQLVRRFAACLLATAAVGWVTFIVFPTACARPDPILQPTYYRSFIALDRANNCLPCLHSAFSVLAAWALIRRAPRFSSRLCIVLLACWVVLICISIVALRQHTDVDMLAGCVLGTVAAWIFDRWSQPRRPTAHHSAIRSTHAPIETR